MGKFVIKILQTSPVTETVLGGLCIFQVANFLWCISTKIYESWFTVDNVISVMIRLTFWLTLYKLISYHLYSFTAYSDYVQKILSTLSQKSATICRKK